MILSGRQYIRARGQSPWLQSPSATTLGGWQTVPRLDAPDSTRRMKIKLVGERSSAIGKGSEAQLAEPVATWQSAT